MTGGGCCQEIHDVSRAVGMTTVQEDKVRTDCGPGGGRWCSGRSICRFGAKGDQRHARAAACRQVRPHAPQHGRLCGLAAEAFTYNEALCTYEHAKAVCSTASHVPLVHNNLDMLQALRRGCPRSQMKSVKVLPHL